MTDMVLRELVCVNIPMHPSGKGRARSSRKSGTHYTPQETRTKETYMMMMSAEHMERNSIEIAKGPVILSVDILMSLPQTLSKEQRRLLSLNMLYPLRKPDIDNVIKSVMDSLNGIAWLDDKQVVSQTTNKIYTDGRPMITIRASEIIEGDQD
jgi:Holliday junction resolvase RusA-like endonuclease